MLGSVDWLAPSLRAYRLAACEYVHAGELFYDDGASALYRIAPGQYWRRFGPILRQELEADFRGRGQPPEAGRVVRLPALARTLRKIAAGGVRAFYEGEIARSLVASLREHGGLHTEADFAAAAAEWVASRQAAPASRTWRCRSSSTRARKKKRSACINARCSISR